MSEQDEKAISQEIENTCIKLNTLLLQAVLDHGLEPDVRVSRRRPPMDNVPYVTIRIMREV